MLCGDGRGGLTSGSGAALLRTCRRGRVVDGLACTMKVRAANIWIDTLASATAGSGRELATAIVQASRGRIEASEAQALAAQVRPGLEARAARGGSR